ncbi:RING-type domain-containing protein [Psidium guajava]|nr:RING-type domain-containing protein [Psidium guajava]
MADIDENYREYLRSLQDPGLFFLEAVAGPRRRGGGGEEEEDEDETEDDRDGVEYIGSQTVDKNPRDEQLGEEGGGGGEACSSGRFGAGGADFEASQSKRARSTVSSALYAWTLGPITVIIKCVSSLWPHLWHVLHQEMVKAKGELGQGCEETFASRLVTVDEESQKKIRFLEAKCVLSENEGESELNERLYVLRRASRLDLLKPLQYGKDDLHLVSWWRISSNFGQQTELRVDGARLFDICASSQMLIIARRLSGIGIKDALTKVSLMYPHETEDIILPSTIKAVRDLHISPFDRSLAVFASLGKTLSVLSLESNSIILAYDLPAAAWSCSWDLNNAHHVYAGLQNGMLLVFDMRQTLKPMESLEGLSRNPIHSIYSLLHKETHGARTILSASSIGLCQWKVDSGEGRPTLVSESADGGVCISLAYCPSSDDVVATYRPKVEMSNEVTTSQPLSTPSCSPVGGRAIQGYHVHFRRVGSSYQKLCTTCANVSDVRLSRSAIVDLENRNRLFASGDEATNQLILQELPSFSVSQQLKLRKHPFRDVKYTSAVNQGLLSCLSEDSLQIFKAMPA